MCSLLIRCHQVSSRCFHAATPGLFHWYTPVYQKRNDPRSPCQWGRPFRHAGVELGPSENWHGLCLLYRWGSGLWRPSLSAI